MGRNLVEPERNLASLGNTGADIKGRFEIYLVVFKSKLVSLVFLQLIKSAVNLSKFNLEIQF